jgi:hypothetical protein
LGGWKRVSIDIRWARSALGKQAFVLVERIASGHQLISAAEKSDMDISVIVRNYCQKLHCEEHALTG